MLFCDFPLLPQILFFPKEKIKIKFLEETKQKRWKKPDQDSFFELKHKTWRHLFQQNSLLSNKKQHFIQIRL